MSKLYFSSISLFIVVLLIITLFESQYIIAGYTFNNIYIFPLFSIIFTCFCVITIFNFCKKIQFSKIDISLFTFAVYIILSYEFRNLEITENSRSTIYAIVCALLIKQLMYYKLGYQIILSLLITIPVLGIIESIYGQLQIIGILHSNHSQFTLTGSFKNPGPYAIYISCILMFNLSILSFNFSTITSENKTQLYSKHIRILYIISSFLIIIIIPVTQSRTAWISTIIGIIIISTIKNIEFLKEKIFSFKNKYKIWTLVTTTTFMTVIVGQLLYNLKPESIHGRLLVWRITIYSCVNNLFFGIGHNEFKFKFLHLQDIYLNHHKYYSTNKREIVTYVFNDYLQVLIETGIIGLSILIVIIILCFEQIKITIKTGGSFVIASFYGMIIILISAFTSYPFELISIWFLFILFISIISFHSNNIYSISIIKNYKSAIILILLLVSIINITKHEIIYFKGLISWEYAKKLFSLGHYNESSKEYRNVVTVLGKRPDILPEHGKSLLMSKNYIESENILKFTVSRAPDPIIYCNLGDAYLASNKLLLSEQSYLKAIEMSPDRMYPRYLLAKMYLNKSDTINAKKVATFILNMQVKIKSSATEEITNEMKKIINYN